MENMNGHYLSLHLLDKSPRLKIMQNDAAVREKGLVVILEEGGYAACRGKEAMEQIYVGAFEKIQWPSRPLF